MRVLFFEFKPSHTPPPSMKGLKSWFDQEVTLGQHDPVSSLEVIDSEIVGEDEVRRFLYKKVLYNWVQSSFLFKHLRKWK